MAASTAFSAFSVALFCCLFSSAAALRNGSVSAFSRGGRSGTCKSSREFDILFVLFCRLCIAAGPSV